MGSNPSCPAKFSRRIIYLLAKNNSKEEYNLYMKEYTLRRYHKLRDKFISTLGGKCVKCGSDSQLEFDHIDPTTKLFTIAKGMTKNKKCVEAEVEKCQLLCIDCHIKKSMLEKGLEDAKHGSHTMYSRYKCRCNICKDSWNKRIRENRKKRVDKAV